MRPILSDPHAREKPCLRCGRSLKKHLDDRFCPDCGLSVWISLNPNGSLDGRCRTRVDVEDARRRA